MAAVSTGTAEPRPEKVAVVTEVRERLSASNGALLTEYRGLKVSDLARLRLALREAGGEYGIYKNTLVRRAAVDLGLDDLVDLLVGPTAIAFVSGDPVAVAKSLRDFAKTNPNLTVKGGLLGKKVLSASEASALADVAPREVVLAQLAGALAAPLVKMAGLLQALPRNFAYGLKALIDQKAGSEPAPAEPSPEATADVTPEAAAPEAVADGAPDGPVPEAPVEAAAAPAPEATVEAAAAPAPEATVEAAEAPAAEAPEAPAPEAPVEVAEAPEAAADVTPEAPAEEAEAPAPEATAPDTSPDTPTTTEETQES
jgi:large subunit ribosomal protein L10